jgi:hypothetical protein
VVIEAYVCGTEKVAGALMTPLKLLLTTTMNCAPSSVIVAGGVV